MLSSPNFPVLLRRFLDFLSLSLFFFLWFVCLFYSLLVVFLFWWTVLLVWFSFVIRNWAVGILCFCRLCIVLCRQHQFHKTMRIIKEEHLLSVFPLLCSHIRHNLMKEQSTKKTRHLSEMRTFLFQHNIYFRCHGNVFVIAPRTRCLWAVLRSVQILRILPFLTLENNSIISPNCGLGPFLIKYLHWCYNSEATNSIFSTVVHLSGGFFLS